MIRLILAAPIVAVVVLVGGTGILAGVGIIATVIWLFLYTLSALF